MTKLAIILNFTITLLLLSALVFTFLSYSDAPLSLSVLLTCVFACLYALCFFAVSKSKREKQLVKSRDKALLEEVKTYLLLESQSSALALFLKGEGITQTKASPVFIDGERLYYPFFERDVLDEFALISIFKRFKGKAIKVFCIAASDKAKELTKTNLKLEILTLEDCFEKIKPYYSPSDSYSFSVTKPNRSEVFSALLNNKSLNAYLLFGLFMLLFSYISPFRLYYLIFAAVLIVGAAIGKFFVRKK